MTPNFPYVCSTISSCQVDQNYHRIFPPKFLKPIKNSSELQIIAARKVLMIEQGPARKMNDRHIHMAVNCVLAYRILDICQWVKKNKPLLNSTVVPQLDYQFKDLLDKLVHTNARICHSSLICFQFRRQLPKWISGSVC